MTDLLAIPVLLSPSIPETRQFGEALGFDVETVGETYAILRGFGLELHFSFTMRPEVCDETSCYIRGGGILEMYKALAASKPARLSPIFSRPWGMSEFYLHDPHGNLLKFGMSTDELPKGLSFPDFDPDWETA